LGATRILTNFDAAIATKQAMPPPSFPIVIPRLTLITDTSRLSKKAFFDKVEQALSGGVDAVLVREKTLTSAKLLALASRLRMMTQAYQAQLIIHSQADVAAAVNADGVHLPSREINSIASVQEWLMQAKITVSVSCHNADELHEAHAMGADYAMLSPVFPTMTHPGAAHLGVEAFDTLVAKAALPIIALGGITTANCPTLQGKRLAVIGSILEASDPKQTAQHLLEATKGRVT